MSTAPQWSPVDDETNDLLALVAMGPLAPPTADEEWAEFVAALRFVAQGNDGVISANAMRELIHDVVKPCRIGPFYSKASAQNLIVVDGWDITEGSPSGNDGKPARLYRWIGEAL